MNEDVLVNSRRSENVAFNETKALCGSMSGRINRLAGKGQTNGHSKAGTARPQQTVEFGGGLENDVCVGALEENFDHQLSSLDPRRQEVVGRTQRPRGSKEPHQPPRHEIWYKGLIRTQAGVAAERTRVVSVRDPLRDGVVIEGVAARCDDRPRHPCLRDRTRTQIDQRGGVILFAAGGVTQSPSTLSAFHQKWINGKP